MDIKAKAEELVNKIKNDPKMLAKFKEDPIAAVEELIGIDLPDDQIKQVAELVKARINLDKMGSLLGGLFGK